MPSLRQQHVMLDLKHLNQDNLTTGWSVEPYDEKDLYLLKATIPGARDTPYEYGLFEIEIKIGELYPVESPKCRFITPMHRVKR